MWTSFKIFLRQGSLHYLLDLNVFVVLNLPERTAFIMRAVGYKKRLTIEFLLAYMTISNSGANSFCISR